MFLKLRLRSTGEDVIINAGQIKYVFPQDRGVTMVYLVGESKQCVEVRETPIAIWKMLAEAK